MKLKPYPEYKDSGVEWVGDMPETWESHKINQIFEIIGSGTTPKSQEELYYENGVIPWVITGDLNDSILNETSKKISREAFRDHSTLKLYGKNSLIIAMYGATIGKISLLNLEACVNQACCVLSNSKILNTRFVFYWFLANKTHIISLGYGGGQPNISQDTIKSLRIQVPSTLEQEKIISFLDKKTSEIDLTIKKDTLLIELLKEKRTALINHLVTKGLEPMVKMKDSGVEWIGEIPEDWEIAKLKHITNLIIDGTHFTPEYVAEGIPFLRVTDIQEDQINFNKIKFISEIEHKLINSRCSPQKGDLLLSKNGTIGIPKVVDWDFDFSIFVSLCLIKLNNWVDVNYLKYFFLSKSIKEQILFRSKTTSVTNLHLDQIKEFYVAFPSIQEQKNIVEHLNREIIKLANLIQKTQYKISLLEEYKKSLIHHVVTGKVDVREVAV